jgi:NADPH:quinone reductase-like Zn-dependent oxidoreductase
VKTEGNHEAATKDVLAELAGQLATGRLEIPIARVYPLAEVRDAYRELEQHHTRGKIVLEP